MNIRSWSQKSRTTCITSRRSIWKKFVLCYSSADHGVFVCLAKVSRITHGWVVKEGEQIRTTPAGFQQRRPAGGIASRPPSKITAGVTECAVAAAPGHPRAERASECRAQGAADCRRDRRVLYEALAGIGPGRR